MAVIKQVYKGSTTLNNSQTSVTVTLSEAVDTTKSFLHFSIRTNVNDIEIPSAIVMGVLTNSTTLTFSRAAANSAVTNIISWQIIEFYSGVTVQRGTVNLNASSVNVAISSVDLTKTFAICTIRSGGTLSYDSFNSEESVRIQLTNATTLTLSISQSSSFSQTVSWQVIEYDACTVQQIDYTVAWNTQVDNISISSINTTRTFICGSFTTSEGQLAGADMYNFYLLDSSTIRIFKAGATSASNQPWTFFVVEFYENEANVLNLNTAISTTDTTVNVSINEINIYNSFASINSGYHTFGAINDVNDQLSRMCFTIALISPTEVQCYRTNSVSVGNIYFQIVEFISTHKQWHLRGLNRGIFNGTT